MGNKNKYAPVIGLFNQILWIYLVLTTKQYGLLLGVMAYTIVHLRNFILWNRKTK